MESLVLFVGMIVAVGILSSLVSGRATPPPSRWPRTGWPQGQAPLAPAPTPGRRTPSRADDFDGVEGVQGDLDFEGRQAADDPEGKQEEGRQDPDDPEGRSLLDTGAPLAKTPEAVTAVQAPEESWLAKREDVVRGVVLAEILGPARAQRPWRGWGHVR